MVQFLGDREGGALLRDKDNFGYTPAIFAAQNGHLEVLKFLGDRDGGALLREGARLQLEVWDEGVLSDERIGTFTLAALRFAASRYRSFHIAMLPRNFVC